MIDQRTQRMLDDLRAEVARLKRQVEQRPMISVGGGGAANPILSLQILGGNILSDAITDGIVWAASPVTSVPTHYDPDVDTTFIDGIGYAVLYSDGAFVGNVLVAHYSGNGSPLQLALAAGMTVRAQTTVSLPVDATDPVEFITAYVPWNP